MFALISPYGNTPALPLQVDDAEQGCARVLLALLEDLFYGSKCEGVETDQPRCFVRFVLPL